MKKLEELTVSNSGKMTLKSSGDHVIALPTGSPKIFYLENLEDISVRRNRPSIANAYSMKSQYIPFYKSHLVGVQYYKILEKENGK